MVRARAFCQFFQPSPSAPDGELNVVHVDGNGGGPGGQGGGAAAVLVSCPPGAADAALADGLDPHAGSQVIYLVVLLGNMMCDGILIGSV